MELFHDSIVRSSEVRALMQFRHVRRHMSSRLLDRSSVQVPRDIDPRRRQKAHRIQSTIRRLNADLYTDAWVCIGSTDAWTRSQHANQNVHHTPHMGEGPGTEIAALNIGHSRAAMQVIDVKGERDRERH